MLGVEEKYVEVGDRAAMVSLKTSLEEATDAAREAVAQLRRAARRPAKKARRGARMPVAGAAADLEKERLAGDRGEVDVEGGPGGAEAGGSGLELEARLAEPVVEAGVGEGHGVGLHRRRVEDAAAGALGAAHLEDVGEVGGEP